VCVCVCVYVCMCVCMCVCLCVCVSGYTFPHFSTDLLQIWSKHSMGNDTYRGILLFSVHATRTRASSRVVKHSFIFGRILFKFAEHILQMTTRYMGYILIMSTYRGHACERACASAREIKHSHIYGRILFKFVGTYYKWPHVTWATYVSCPRTRIFQKYTSVIYCTIASVKYM
jgi:hypothetical protein